MFKTIFFGFFAILTLSGFLSFSLDYYNDKDDKFPKDCDYNSMKGKEFFFTEKIYLNKKYDYTKWFKTPNPIALTPNLKHDEYVGKRAKEVKQQYNERSKFLMRYIAVTEDCETIYGNLSKSDLLYGQSPESYLETFADILFLEPVIEKAKALIGKEIWAAKPLGINKADFIFTPDPNISYPKKNLDKLRIIGIDTTRYEHVYGGKIYGAVPLFLVVKTEKEQVGLIPYDVIKHHEKYYYEPNPDWLNWDEELIAMMKNQKIKLGMTEDQVWISLGEPKEIKPIDKSRNHQLWIYDNEQYLQFEKGILKDIKATP